VISEQIYSPAQDVVLCVIPRLSCYHGPADAPLSERRIRCAELIPTQTSVTTASSTATISAHPMSRPSDFHPSLSFHANQRSCHTKPIPHEVDASTWILQGEGSGMDLIASSHRGADRRAHHHLMSEAACQPIRCLTR